ncbi:serine kinase [Arthrobacter sp. YC-RL1]|uniref:homoserine kinase n=1 Tax=Arthrobacter sp. YC-RL1 TaxID=1652545 RepID=UPI00063DBE22|nr:homoserine kinase [Arthrobacter sp. YC-RL1]ALQ31182.1 homoserine kinase [Arthrobacter sp. YC-RL1]KLI87557.1 serine kinase [Arthrobacter sp. YC-RL1]
MQQIALGQHLVVAPPATTANLGPGFDSLGLALEFRDRLEIRTAPQSTVQISGDGADSLPRDESHLIIREMHRYWEQRGFAPVGIELKAANNIPHARGMGSSAAAIVAAYAAADALLPAAERGGLDAVFQAAAAWEGHPDNVAPAVYGGLSISATNAGGTFSCALVPVHTQVRAVLAIPSNGLSTEVARGVLPAQIAHADAAANTASGALLIHALSNDPSHLLGGTVDYLHQSYRAASMPESSALIALLREHQLAAVVSGAGPTVLALVAGDAQERLAGELIEQFSAQSSVSWRAEFPRLAANGVTVEVL